jgi:heptosyltransferase II
MTRFKVAASPVLYYYSVCFCRRAYYMNTSGRFSNILIIKPGAIGDLLQMTPVIRALKVKYPEAAVSLLVGSSQTAGLFTYHTAVHEIIVYDKKGKHHSFSALLDLWRQLRRKGYDLVINFQRSNMKTWFLTSAALPCRLLVYHKSRNRNVHAVVNYIETLAPLGIHAEDLHLELTPGAEDRVFAMQLLSARNDRSRPLIALNPGASHQVNRWSTDRFAALADMLSQRLDARVIIVGGPEDVALAEEIASKAVLKPLLLAGKASLLQLGAVLEQCAALVSGDTGPLHLATAVGTPVVALFGAADPARTGPVGDGHIVLQSEKVACVPCRSRSCSNSRYLECMDAITVDSVFDAVTALVRKGKPVRK